MIKSSKINLLLECCICKYSSSSCSLGVWCKTQSFHIDPWMSCKEWLNVWASICLRDSLASGGTITRRCWQLALSTRLSRMWSNCRTRWRPADMFGQGKWVEGNFYQLKQILTWTIRLKQKESKMINLGLNVGNIVEILLQLSARHWGCSL